MNVNKPILVTDLNIQMELIMLCFPNITQTVRLVVYVYTQNSYIEYIYYLNTNRLSNTLVQCTTYIMYVSVTYTIFEYS